MKKRILVLLLVLLTASILFAGGSQESDAAADGSMAVKVGTTEELGQLLEYSTAGECGAGMFLVFDMLFYYDAEDKLASDVITEYHFEDDGFTLVLSVRQGVTFSSGNTLTGEDVLFSITSTTDPDRKAVQQNFGYFDFDKCYVGEDGYTVYLTTKDTATAVSQFSLLAQVCVLDKIWVEENGWDSELWYTGPSGSGPYKVAKYLTGKTYTFELRDDWWMSYSNKTYPDVFTLTSYSEKSTMYMDLENGDIDIAIEPGSNDFERSLKDGDNIDGVYINGNVCNWVVFDVEDSSSPTTDIAVRKALAHGVDWDQVAIAGKGVKWSPATSSIPSYFPDYVNLGKYEFDPDYARKVLADAGYKDGDIEIYMVLSVNAQASGAVIQAYLADIGITMNFDGFEIATAVPKWIEGEGDIATFAMQGGSVAHDPYWVYKEIASTAIMADNRTISDSTIDDNLAKALLAPSQEAAHGYYVDIQNWIYDNYRVVSYFEEVNAACFNTDVISSVHFNSKQYPDLRNVTYTNAK